MAKAINFHKLQMTLICYPHVQPWNNVNNNDFPLHITKPASHHGKLESKIYISS